jgi:hypothetical protein
MSSDRFHKELQTFAPKEDVTGGLRKVGMILLLCNIHRKHTRPNIGIMTTMTATTTATLTMTVMTGIKITVIMTTVMVRSIVFTLN